MKHTPTPWELGPDPYYKNKLFDAQFGHIVGEGLSPMGDAEAEANAHFIHDACNSFDDLLSMCKELLSALDEVGTPHDISYVNGMDIESITLLLEEAHTTISKAEGKSNGQ